MKELRTRFLPKLLNKEVEEYLTEHELIIVPVGTVEMHGGMPLDSETVISEAFALCMAEKVNSLVLSGLLYFYAGATATGRGTVQVSVRQGIDYLGAVARSLLRQGFKKQIYVSFHGPAHMTCSPMIRDFFDETGAPALYIDLTMQMMKQSRDLFTSMESFHAITLGAYHMLGRLEEVPLSTEYYHEEAQTIAPFQRLLDLGYQSGSMGYYFGEQKDHMSTPILDTEETRLKLALEGEELIRKITERMNLAEVVESLEHMDKFQKELMKQYPWLPAAWENNRK